MTKHDPQAEHDRQEPDWDPVFLNSRREAKVIFFFWLCGLLWCVPSSYILGYGEKNAETMSVIWGVPTWLFWGIAVPWLVSDLLTTWFCFFFMKDDELDEVEGESE